MRGVGFMLTYGKKIVVTAIAVNVLFTVIVSRLMSDLHYFPFV